MFDDMINDRRFVIFCTIGIVIVSIIAIVAIGFVWKKNFFGDQTTEVSGENNITNTKSAELGKYTAQTTTAKQQLDNYTIEIATMIMNADIDRLYKKLDSGYVKYFSYDQDKFRNLLEKKGYFGKKVNMLSYKSATLKNKNIYNISLATVDGKINGTFNIIESSPNNYSIAFDDFVLYEQEPKEYIQDGIQFIVYDQVWYNSRYTLKAKLKNLNDDSYIINANRLYENNYLRLSTGNDIRTLSTVVSGDYVKLEKDHEMNYLLEYSIPELSYMQIKSYIVKDIKSEKTNIVKDYIFEI